MTEKRKPWIKWFTRDWRSNAKLRMCGYAARGLWADMISLMGEAEHFGFLMINGVVPTCKQLAGLLGGTEREVTKLRAELGEANVYSVTGFDMPADVKALIPKGMPDGVILSRRMVRDKAKADRDAKNGKGGGNPNLAPPDNRGVNPQANPQRSEARRQKLEQGDEASSSGAAGALAIVDEAFALWSSLASDLQIPDTGFLNGDRRAALHARLHEIGGVDGWALALEKVRVAEFFFDPGGKPKRWLNLGWLLKPENFTGLMEGRYAERHTEPASGLDAALAELGRAGAG